MDAREIALTVLCLLVAGVVKGASGLGYSSTALPLLALTIGLHRAMPIVPIPSIVVNLGLMSSVGHFAETARRFLPLYVALLPGLAAGLALLGRVDEAAAATFLGAVILLYALWALRRPHFELSIQSIRRLQVPVGAATGFVNGLTGSQIMPVVPYMLAAGLDPNRFVQAVNISFTLSSLVMMLGLRQAGLLTGDAFLMSVAGVVPALAGSWLGSRLRGHLPEARFRVLVLGVLAALGAALLARPLV